MPDFLTPAVNVPAERAKLRALRDEIAAQVADREAYERRYTPRGYLRTHMPDLQTLAPEGIPSHGPATLRPLHAGAGLGVPAAAGHMPEAQACGAGVGRAACGLECEGVTL